MFFLLSKALHFLISPLVWVLTLLVFAFFMKKANTKKKLLASAFILLYLLSTPLVYNLLLSTWEVEATELKEEYEVAIVLLGFTSLDQSPTERIHVTQSVNRITQLIPLYRAGVVKKILLTGGSSAINPKGKSEAEETKKLLLQWQVKESDILLEPKARNTYENLVFAKALLEEKNITSKLLLVSSGYHLKRGIACAKKLGLEVTPYATDFRATPMDNWLVLITPSAGAIGGIEKLIHEWVGFVMYKVKGFC